MQRWIVLSVINLTININEFKKKSWKALDIQWGRYYKTQFALSLIRLVDWLKWVSEEWNLPVDVFLTENFWFIKSGVIVTTPLYLMKQWNKNIFDNINIDAIKCNDIDRTFNIHDTNMHKISNWCWYKCDYMKYLFTSETLILF